MSCTYHSQGRFQDAVRLFSFAAPHVPSVILNGYIMHMIDFVYTHKYTKLYENTYIIVY